MLYRVLKSHHGLWLIPFVLIAAGCVTGSRIEKPARRAEASAVAFLQREVPAWPRDNGCFSCHHNGDAARALYVATLHGYPMPSNVLAATTAWISQPDGWDENKGDPGFNDKRLANLQFAAALLAATRADHVDHVEASRKAARRVAADQATDGSWPVEPQNPVGSPATHGTALATYQGLQVLKGLDPAQSTGAMRSARNWLKTLTPDTVPASAALLMTFSRDNVQDHLREFPLLSDLARTEMRAPLEAGLARKLQESLRLLRQGQTPDGGWGPYADSPPEPFDTALALLALTHIREVRGVEEMIRRGRRFLVETQLPDGSWPETTRPPKGQSYAQRVSTAAWATLALLETRKRP